MRIKDNLEVLPSKDSIWFTIEKGKLKDVTLKLYNDVEKYNKQQKEEYFTKIPYRIKDGFITYSFGCGLTHYLQDNNLKDVTSLNVDRISVFTTDDFTMYDIKKTETDWHSALETMLKERGDI